MTASVIYLRLDGIVKADRLISLLLLLQSRRRCTARTLAETLEVSERTIYRDVDALGAAGVPVYAERGSAGGILLADGYRRTLTHFNEDEIRALFVSGASPLADLGLGNGLDRALEKLRGGLADVQRRAAEESRTRIHLDQRRWNQEEPSRELLTALRRAVWDDRRLRIRYEDRNRKATTRTIEPLGLVSKAGVWYAIARTSGEMRSYRVERIRAIEELPERFERPQEFDLEVYWRESTRRFAQESRSETCVATMRVRADALERVTESYWTAEIVSTGDGDALVRVTFPGNDAAVFQAIAWVDCAHVVEPAELRDLVVARARQAYDAYGVAR
jgi:predicted DNA-binding transcriptional regulator YafY